MGNINVGNHINKSYIQLAQRIVFNLFANKIINVNQRNMFDIFLSTTQRFCYQLILSILTVDHLFLY